MTDSENINHPAPSDTENAWSDLEDVTFSGEASPQEPSEADSQKEKSEREKKYSDTFYRIIGRAVLKLSEIKIVASLADNYDASRGRSIREK